MQSGVLIADATIESNDVLTESFREHNRRRFDAFLQIMRNVYWEDDGRRLILPICGSLLEEREFAILVISMMNELYGINGSICYQFEFRCRFISVGVCFGMDMKKYIQD